MTGTGERLDLFRRDKIRAIKQGSACAVFINAMDAPRLAPSWTPPPFASPPPVNGVSVSFVADAHVFHRALERNHIRERGDGFQFVERMIVLLRREDGHLPSGWT